MKFQIFTGKDQQVYFHIKGDNGEILTHSEGYSRKESAQDTIEAIKKAASSASIVDET
ncbi:YegP family protein [Geomonas sp.]|uniref:YegP family protein n=1 Tax=Geomonas sp. TaxID=2651584 RepID=UPI002B47C229|nr:YegP family protein [Geomonas sp.]HJV36335.1 YegP family protein [Geomonas sp.]